jgi:hypothetical protein
VILRLLGSITILIPYKTLLKLNAVYFRPDMSLFVMVQTRSKLYLVLDFINGGHLFFQLYRQGTFRCVLGALI